MWVFFYIRGIVTHGHNIDYYVLCKILFISYIKTLYYSHCKAMGDHSVTFERNIL